jgi:outer membrane receptor protein involved in Fe transport
MTEQAFTSARPAVAVLVAAIAAIASPPAAAVDEILVTARRVEENIQDVPLAVSAFTAEQIQQLNLRTIDELARFTPGFSFNSAFGRQPGSDRPTIRGITTIQNGIGNASSAAYFIDGIYLGGSPQSTELTNLERFEVVKGPQAAQFGRGTFAGAINYVTRKPSLDGVEGGAQLTGAEFGTFEGSAWVSAPIVEDRLGFYLSAGYNESEGAFDNQRPGTDGKLGGTEDINLTAKLLFAPVEGLEITLKGGIQQTDDDHFAIYLQPRGLNNDFFRGAPGSGVAPRAREYYVGEAVPDWDNMNIATDILEAGGLSGTELDRAIGTLSVVYTDPTTNLTFSSLTGYVDDSIKTGFDVSYAAYEPLFSVPGQQGTFFQLDKDESEVFTQEFRITTDQAKRLRGTGGVYLFRQEDSEIFQDAVNPAGTALDVQLPVARVPLSASPLTQNRVTNLSLFGGVEYDITDRWTAGVEGRYAQDRIKQVNDANGCVAGSPGCSTSGPFEATFSAFTPRVTTRFRLTDDVNLYANVAAGTRPGTFNANVPADEITGLPDESFRAVDEERLISYEVGAKTAWFDRRLVANVAVYYNDLKDQQLTVNIEGPGGIPQSAIVNIGKTEVWGAELDLQFEILENWTGQMIYAWTDSEITERISPDEAELRGWDGNADTIAQFGDVAGNQSPRVPEHQFGFNTRYELPLSWGGLYVGADYTYEDSRFAQEHNLIETGSRSLLGARLGARFGDNWDFQVWARNLTDNEAPVDILRYIDRRSGTLTPCATVGVTPPGTCSGSSTSPRGFALTPTIPRQYGATLSYRFGGNR